MPITPVFRQSLTSESSTYFESFSSFRGIQYGESVPRRSRRYEEVHFSGLRQCSLTPVLYPVIGDQRLAASEMLTPTTNATARLTTRPITPIPTTKRIPSVWLMLVHPS